MNIKVKQCSHVVIFAFTAIEQNKSNFKNTRKMEHAIARTFVPLISKNIAVNYLYMYYMVWPYFLRWTRRHRCWQTTTMTMAMMTRVTASSQYNWSVSKLELETGTRTTSHSAEQHWLLVYITGCCLLTTEHKISFLYILFGICDQNWPITNQLTKDISSNKRQVKFF